MSLNAKKKDFNNMALLFFTHISAISSGGQKRPGYVRNTIMPQYETMPELVTTLLYALMLC